MMGKVIPLIKEAMADTRPHYGEAHHKRNNLSMAPSGIFSPLVDAFLHGITNQKAESPHQAIPTNRGTPKWSNSGLTVQVMNDSIVISIIKERASDRLNVRQRPSSMVLFIRDFCRSSSYISCHFLGQGSLRPTFGPTRTGSRLGSSACSAICGWA